jgi:UDP-glucuronate decarboxylase
MLELATKVLEVSGERFEESSSSPCPRTTPGRGDPTYPRRKSRLGWKPAVGLDEGIRETVRYFRNSLDA